MLNLRRSDRLSERPGRSMVSAVAVAATIVVAAAGPALAVDATGTWSGGGTCWQGTRARATRTEQPDSTMLISQRAQALFVEVDGTAYQGACHDTSRTRARGSAARSTDGAGACPDSEVLALRIRVDEARETTRIYVVSTVANHPDARRCRFRYSRISREDPGVGESPPEAFCGDGVVNQPTEECDGAATGTACDAACTPDCACPTTCEPLDVTGRWEGSWVSEVTGDSGPVVATLSHYGDLVFGGISFPPFGDENFSPPFLEIRPCAPAEFSTGALLPSGIAGRLDGIATNTSLAGIWGMSDGSDHGTWSMSR